MWYVSSTVKLARLGMFCIIGAASIAASSPPVEDCDDLLSHFSTLDSSIERPLSEIFKNHTFEMISPKDANVSELRLSHFYTLVQNEVLKSRPSKQLYNWIITERELGEKVRAGELPADETIRILRHTLQAMVVTAVATDLLPIVDDTDTEYKLVVASLVLSRRVPPPKWKINLRALADPVARNFVRTSGVTHYSLFHLLQKGPFSGRVEILYRELADLQPRAAKALSHLEIDDRVRPYIERVLGRYADVVQQPKSWWR